MGCCIIGAIVFGFLFGLWRRIGALFGVEVGNKKQNPVLWTYGSTPAPEMPVVKKPLLAPRFAALLMAVSLSIGAVVMAVQHGAHIRQEVTCGLHQAGLTLGDSALLCMAGVDHHSHHH